MTFTESNTVEQVVLDAAARLSIGPGSSLRRQDLPVGLVGVVGKDFKPEKKSFCRLLKSPRQSDEKHVAEWGRYALVAIKAEIFARPDRTNDLQFTPLDEENVLNNLGIR